MKKRLISLVMSVMMLMPTNMFVFSASAENIDVVTDFENFPKVQNGSFEDGSFKNWTVVKEDCLTIDTEKKIHGNYSVKYVSDGESGVIAYQEVEALTNANYVAAAALSRASDVTVRIYADEINDDDLLAELGRDSLQDDVYNEFGYFVTGENKKIIITLFDKTGNVYDDCYIDNIYIVPSKRLINQGFEDGTINGISATGDILSVSLDEKNSGNSSLKIQTGDKEQILFIPIVLNKSNGNNDALVRYKFKYKIENGSAAFTYSRKYDYSWNKILENAYDKNFSVPLEQTGKWEEVYSGNNVLVYANDISSVFYYMFKVAANTTMYLDDVEILSRWNADIDKITISGENTVGSVLTARIDSHTNAVNDINLKYPYRQWQHSNDGINWTNAGPEEAMVMTNEKWGVHTTYTDYTVMESDSDMYLRLCIVPYHSGSQVKSSVKYYSKSIKIEKIKERTPSFTVDASNDAFYRILDFKIGDEYTVNDEDKIKNLSISGLNKADYNVTLNYDDEKVVGFTVKILNDFSKLSKNITVKNALYDTMDEKYLDISYDFEMSSVIEKSEDGLKFISKSSDVVDFKVFRGIYDSKKHFLSYDEVNSFEGVAEFDEKAEVNSGETVNIIVYDNDQKVLYVEKTENSISVDNSEELFVNQKNLKLTLNAKLPGEKTAAPCLATVIYEGDKKDVKAIYPNADNKVAFESYINKYDEGIYNVTLSGFAIDEIKEFSTEFIYAGEDINSDKLFDSVTDIKNFPKVKNGSFETGDMEEWTIEKNASVSVVKGKEANGTYALEYKPDGNVGVIAYQEVDALQGITYMFSAAVDRANEISARVYSEEISDDKLLCEITSASRSGIYSNVKNFNSGSTKKFIVAIYDKAGAKSGSNAAYIDNIILAPARMMTNPGFENGTVSGIISASSKITYTEEESNTGKGSLKIQTGPNGDSAYFVIPIAMTKDEQINRYKFNYKIEKGSAKYTFSYNYAYDWDSLVKNSVDKKEFDLPDDESGAWQLLKSGDNLMIKGDGTTKANYFICIKAMANTTIYIDDIDFYSYDAEIDKITITGDNKNGAVLSAEVDYHCKGYEVTDAPYMTWQRSTDGVDWTDITSESDMKAPEAANKAHSEYKISIADSDSLIRLAVTPSHKTWRTKPTWKYYSESIKIKEFMPAYSVNVTDNGFSKKYEFKIGKNYTVQDENSIKNLIIDGLDKSNYSVEMVTDNNKVIGFNVNIINDFGKNDKNIAIAEVLYDQTDKASTDILYTFKTESIIKQSADGTEFTSTLSDISDFTVFRGVYDSENQLKEYVEAVSENGTAKLEKNLKAGERETLNTIVYDDEQRVLYVDNIDTESNASFADEGLFVNRDTLKLILKSELDCAKMKTPVLSIIQYNGNKKNVRVMYPDDENCIYFETSLNNNEWGEYTATVGGYTVGTVLNYESALYPNEDYELAFKKINQEENDGTVQKVTSEDIKKFLIMFGINAKKYPNINDEKFAELINSDTNKISVSELGENIKEAKDILSKLLIIEAYNESADGLIDDNCKMKYSNELLLPKIDNNNVTLFNIYNTAVSNEGLTEINKRLMGKNIKSCDEFDKLFKEAVILCGIEYTSYGGTEYIKDILTEKNIKSAGISADKYLSLSQADKQLINKSIVKKSFADIKALEDAINKDPEKNQTSSGGSSSGGSYSSSSNSSSKAPMVPGVGAITNTFCPVTSMSFTDVPDNHWAYKYIYTLNEINIINGVGDNKFAPNDTVTREQFVKILCNAFDLKPSEKEVTFDDCKSGAWYEKYVKTAASCGIVNGIDERHFGVGMPITREDICVMALRALNTEVTDDKVEFADAELVSDYAKEAVATLSMLKIISGFEDETFRPKDYCTRAQAAKIVFEIMNIKEDID